MYSLPVQEINQIEKKNGKKIKLKCLILLQFIKFNNYWSVPFDFII